MVIITLLTQVRKEKNGKTNFRLGIDREEWGDELLSWVMAWCLVYWTPSLWVPGSMPGWKFVFPFFSFPTCVNRVIITIPSPGALRIPIRLNTCRLPSLHSKQTLL